MWDFIGYITSCKSGIFLVISRVAKSLGEVPAAAGNHLA